MRMLNEVYVAIDNAAVMSCCRTRDRIVSHKQSNTQTKKKKTNFVFPLKFCPHLSELGICTRSRLDVIHDVNVNITENHTVSVTGCSRDIIHCKRTHTFFNVPKSEFALYNCAELPPAS